MFFFYEVLNLVRRSYKALLTRRVSARRQQNGVLGVHPLGDHKKMEIGRC
jgi:hypothetical protein